MTLEDRNTHVCADLRELQRLLTRLITAPNGVAEGLAREPALTPRDLDVIVRGDERMTARERLEIYANAYFYRLLDVLREDYPLILAALRDDSFHNLITGYLLEFPPTEPSIFFAGRYLAQYLRTGPLAAERPWLAELAAFERAMLEAFHAPDAPALDAAAMRAIPAADWPAVAMRLSPAARLIACAWRVDELAGANPQVKLPQPPRRSPATILVWRRDGEIFFRSLAEAERAAIAIADRSEGARFAEICDEIAAHSPELSAAPAAINRMLAVWLNDGLMVRADR